jgi:hypothetical protein
MRPFVTSSTVLVVFASALLSGCGGTDTVAFKKAGPPPPAKCLKSYNRDPTAVQLGRHAYSPSHGSRAARVTTLNKPEYLLKDECLVIYADREGDREYGTLGQFTTNAGWTSMIDFPLRSEKQRIALQRTGAEAANAKLNSDGTLSSF